MINLENIGWEHLFQAMSWIYSISWTFSFYGQIFENFRLKNVEGMNLNFAAINLNGFLFYSLYSLYGYFINQDQTGQLRTADLFFALHGFAATLFTNIQAIIYPKGSNRISSSAIIFIICQWSFIIIYYLLIKSQYITVHKNLSYVSCMGYFKLMSSGLKYIPQLLWNCKRKTTVGWSISSVIMDLTGGVFSFLQIILQTVIIPNFNVNITKLLLGLLTIVYDALFIHQHFWMYPKVNQKSIGYDSPSTIEISNQINQN